MHIEEGEAAKKVGYIGKKIKVVFI